MRRPFCKTAKELKISIVCKKIVVIKVLRFVPTVSILTGAKCRSLRQILRALLSNWRASPTQEPQPVELQGRYLKEVAEGGS